MLSQGGKWKQLSNVWLNRLEQHGLNWNSNYYKINVVLLGVLLKHNVRIEGVIQIFRHDPAHKLPCCAADIVRLLSLAMDNVYSVQLHRHKCSHAHVSRAKQSLKLNTGYSHTRRVQIHTSPSLLHPWAPGQDTLLSLQSCESMEGLYNTKIHSSWSTKGFNITL